MTVETWQGRPRVLEDNDEDEHDEDEHVDEDNEIVKHGRPDFRIMEIGEEKRAGLSHGIFTERRDEHI